MATKSKEKMLSKSRIISAYQCKKLLYLSLNRPKLLPPISASTQAIFDQGHEVGIEAQKRFPKGILIEAEAYEAQKAFKATLAAIENGANTIYEATFIHNNVQARIDILHRKNSKSAWEIVEVKSSTGIDEVHLKDVAIQTWVAKGAGIKISKSKLMHINNECVFPDLSNLFTVEDVTEEINDWIKDVPKMITSIRKMLNVKKVPDNDIGPHCNDPYECPLIEHCWKHIPEESIFILPRIGKKAWELYEDGLVDLHDKKLLKMKFNETQKRVIEVTQTGNRYIDNSALKKELSTWIEPFSYLDFETVSFAIPRYNKTRPYQQIPFQFSVQVENGKKVKSFEYLHDNDKDPRPQLIEALIKSIPSKGSVVSFNKGFESARMKEMAESFPKHKKALQNIIDRLVDPLPIIRSNVYDKGFQGSFSIKKVAPSLIGEKYSYDSLSIADGGAASQGFISLITEELSTKERDQLRSDMLKYCDQDTMSMVELVNWMRSIK